uniref:NADH dehydrogenase subunit 6 n=1 Tax=Symphyocladia marchantioides TaxID=88360 RepID=UPI0022FD471B|nr:NADH dehydrogenase subunit 6 [Symphyocladia marchantioides]WAX04048.1 NADH dehydrogenase subunit 6 [Symphyocladia marchantioides]
MFLENPFFFLFFFFISSSALSVIFAENSIYSVLFLILTFFNVILLLLFLGAEFLAFLLLIVYIGAIAVLFLFVVMMLNIKSPPKIINYFLLYYTPLFFLIFIFLLDFFWNFFTFFDVLKNLPIKLHFTNYILQLSGITNIESIGNVLYTNYAFLFIIAGFILLVAMIGVIVLTIHQKTIFLLRKQNINYQNIRESKKILKFIFLRNKI